MALLQMNWAGYTHWAVLVVVGLTACMAHAEVAVGPLFSSHMVLQQEMEVPVWGTASPGEKVTVSFEKQSVTAQADAKGKWMVKLSPLKATPNQQGQKLTIAGSNTLVFDDVLVGEVWLGSGQSNMNWTVSQSNDAKNEIAAANYPQIRMFNVSGDRTHRLPVDEYRGQWSVCSPQTVAGFSGVGYYYGRYLHKQLDVPVGIIISAVGGTVGEAWLSREGLHATVPEMDDLVEKQVYPGTWLDEEIKKYKQTAIDREPALKKLAEVEADMDAANKVAAVDFDDSSWETVGLPKGWSGSMEGMYDGMHWFRKTIGIPASWAGRDLILKPGAINTIDVTWFNGEIVGQSGNFANGELAYIPRTRNAVPREYRVPGRLVKAGKNVIAIRDINTVGFWGVFNPGGKALQVELAEGDEEVIPLTGEWKINYAFKVPGRPLNPENPNRPTVLFNGLIHPIIPVAMRGVIWYQGESNSHVPEPYYDILRGLISDWRSRWGQGDFPFYIVQLPNYVPSGAASRDYGWVAVREAQARVDRDVPNTELAVIIDLVGGSVVHHPNKQDVGARLALIALNQTYGKDVPYLALTYKSHQVKDSKVIVTFNNLYGGLVLKGQKIEGYKLAGADGKFMPATATIEGDTLVVSSDLVPQPVHVSYGMENDPPSTLYNKAGLPTQPFSTLNQ